MSRSRPRNNIDPSCTMTSAHASTSYRGWARRSTNPFAVFRLSGITNSSIASPAPADSFDQSGKSRDSVIGANRRNLSESMQSLHGLDLSRVSSTRRRTTLMIHSLLSRRRFLATAAAATVSTRLHRAPLFAQEAQSVPEVLARGRAAGATAKLKVESLRGNVTVLMGVG